MRKNTFAYLTACLALTFTTGCTEQMSQLGSSILSSTGFVSGSQADAIFKAGEKFSKAVEGVTDEQEYYLGRSVSAVLLSKYKVASNQQATVYADKIALTLAGYSSRPETFGGYHVAFLDSPQVNAVSAPGGFIFISKGFLNLLSNEDELAAVIAHEIGHIALKHGTSAISESNLTDALQIIGKEAASSSGNMAVSQLNSLFGDSVNEVVGTLLDKGYSRSQEYDADSYAAALLAKTGYNPGALVSVLQKLENASSQSGGWFETHPSAKKRESELGDLVKDSSNTKAQAKRDARFKRTVK